MGTRGTAMFTRAALVCQSAARGFSLTACNRWASTAHVPVSTIAAVNHTMPAWRLGYATSAAQKEEGQAEDEDDVELIQTKNGFTLKAKQVKHSPKKLTLLLRFPTGMNLTEAYAQCALSEKRIAKTRLKQLIK